MEEKNSSTEVLTFKSNYIITKSNQLIMNASYELSVEEQRIVLLLISKVQPTDTSFKKYILKVTDYMKITDNSAKSVYNEMKKAIIKLMTRIIYIDKDGEESPLICHWISSAQPREGIGEFEISIHDELQDFLLGLFPKNKLRLPENTSNIVKTEITEEKKGNFTSYKYSIASKLKSKYSYRLYEMLKCHEYHYGFTISLEEFKKLLFINGKAYETYGNINNKILKICVREINSITDINFNVKPLKQVKKVIALNFTIHTNKTKKN